MAIPSSTRQVTLTPLANSIAKTQLVVPVYNEGENARILYNRLQTDGVEFDSLKYVYDFEADNTLPVINELKQLDPRVSAEKNNYGKGAVNALRWGFAHAGPGPVLVIMGDNSDKLSIIPALVSEWQQGASIVSPSRYMKGGEQHGGGFLKSTLSRVAGVSLKLLGFPTADPTNNFKLYDGAWLSQQTIESVGGFEIALELCYKAYAQGKKITEVPTVWTDRELGESRFRLFHWLPHYLKWYFRCLGALFVRRVLRA